MTIDRTFEAIAIKEIDGSNITESFVNIGTALSNPLYIIFLFNNTDATVYISEDGTNNHYKLTPGTSREIDLQTNKADQRIGAKGVGVQFSVKGIKDALPTCGSVWIEGQTL